MITPGGIFHSDREDTDTTTMSHPAYCCRMDYVWKAGLLAVFLTLDLSECLSISNGGVPSPLNPAQAGVMDSSQDKLLTEDVPNANPSLIQTGAGALVLQIHENGTMQLSMSNTTAKPVETNTTAAHLSVDDPDVLYMVNDTKSSIVVPFVGPPSTTTPFSQVIVQGNHRIELEPIDFQMNSTKNATTKVNVVVTVIVTAGSIPVWAIKRRKETLGVRVATGAVSNISLSNLPAGQAIVMQQPETTTGVQMLFNGTYDPVTNKVPVPRTFFLDLCGALSDKAFIQVAVSPPVGHQYFCAMNIAFPSAARDSEAFWTEPLQCNSESQDVEDWSFRLWFKVRQYNINWSQCQQNRPVFAK